MDEDSEVPTVRSVAADDSDETTALLKGMHNTISTDQSDAADSLAWMPAKAVDDDEEVAASKEVETITIPTREPATVDTDEFPQDRTHPDALPGATALGAQIRQKLHDIPGINLSDNSPNQQLIEYLIKSVARLSIENELLRKTASETSQGTTTTTTQESKSAKSQTKGPDEPTKPIFKEYHVVYCANSKRNYFYDGPRIFKGDLKSDHLRGLQGIENISTHLDRNKDLVFTIQHEYFCFCNGGPDYQRMVGYKDGKLLDDSPPAESKDKFVMLNKSLRDTLLRIVQKHKDRFPGLEGNPRAYCEEPFLPFYIHNKTFLELADSSNLNDFDLKSTVMLCTWFEENYRKVWNETDQLLARGKITFKHYKRLFRPGELIIVQQYDAFETTVAYRAKPHSWKEYEKRLYVEYWAFNGAFQRLEGSWDLTLMVTRQGEEITEYDGEVDIADLIFYPLRFAKPGLRDQLIARGNRFWRSRKKTLISYNDPDLETNKDEKPVSLLWNRVVWPHF